MRAAHMSARDWTAPWVTRFRVLAVKWIVGSTLCDVYMWSTTEQGRAYRPSVSSFELREVTQPPCSDVTVRTSV